MRGKHGQSAAVRHDFQAIETDLATYQRRVAKLTAENRELREKLATEEQRHRKAERVLLARLNQAAAPKIEALEILVAARTRERDAVSRELDDLSEKWNRAFKRLGEHFRHAHGLDGVEVGEAIIPIMFHDDLDSTDRALVRDRNLERHLPASANADAIRTLQVARGERPARPRSQAQ